VHPAKLGVYAFIKKKKTGPLGISSKKEVINQGLVEKLK
jgi:hypothetical protein